MDWGHVWEMPNPIVVDRGESYRDLEDQFDILSRQRPNGVVYTPSSQGRCSRPEAHSR